MLYWIRIMCLCPDKERFPIFMIINRIAWRFRKLGINSSHAIQKIGLPVTVGSATRNGMSTIVWENLH